MKIKFARTLAIASALSVAFAGLTAFAAKIPTVETITTYDHASSADVTVTTTIKGLTDGTEVAYYVCDENNNNDIVYIDQATFDADVATGLEFKFTDTKEDFLRAMAKFGSNEADGATFPTFIFNEGTNYLTQVTAQAEMDDTIWNKDLKTAGITVTDGDVAETALAFKGKVSGAATAYGVKIVTSGAVAADGGSKTYYFPAYGCAEDGTFVVIIEGYTPGDGDVISAYALPETVVAD